ncbi:MAG TPA: DUF2339 domain-containing protein [Phycisphaerae bacterium]
MLVAVTCKWLIGDELVRRLDPTWSPTSVLPVLNGQMAMAVAIAACIWWAARLRSADRGASQTGWAPAGLGLVLICGLVFETDRIIGRWELAHATSWKPTWPPLQTRMLWWTFLSAASGLLMLLIGRRRTHRPLIETGTVLMIAAALFWLAIDTVGWRVVAGTAAAWLVLNQQFLIGVFLVLALSLAVRLIRVTPALRAALLHVTPHPVGIPLALIAIMGLWLGSLEIDRFFAHAGSQIERAAMARQTGLSIYWGLYGIALVAVGFARTSRWSRYGGLALLGLTLGKVLLVDMAEIRSVYRVLSLLGLGLLFVITSITYTKLAPVLLGEASGKR